jgi:hypothetical protein
LRAGQVIDRRFSPDGFTSLPGFPRDDLLDNAIVDHVFLLMIATGCSGRQKKEPVRAVARSIFSSYQASVRGNPGGCARFDPFWPPPKRIPRLLPLTGRSLALPFAWPDSIFPFVYCNRLQYSTRK